MAGKTKKMNQVKQLLLYLKDNKPIKSIAYNLGMSKNTVKAYRKLFNCSKLSMDELLKLEDPELERHFFSGNPAYKDPRYEYIKDNLRYYESELHRTGVTKHLLWEEYKLKCSNGYGYTQFCYHLRQQLVARKPSAVLSHQPGNELYVDFAGKNLSYVNRDTGEIIICAVFVATLPFSDYSFAMAVPSQSISDFIHALLLCILFYGGAPRILVSDNLKAAIVKASRYEPEATQAIEDFCNYYGISIVPARVRKPQDKALVEDAVKILYTRVYAKLRDRLFFSLHELNEAILEKIVLHNQTRMQRKPFSREENFIANEKALLQALPQEKYELKYYLELTLGKNNHIYFSPDKHYYSSPYVFIGEKVKVIYTRTLVKLFIRGEKVAVHKRDERPGGYTTVKEHLCSHHQHYLYLSPDYYIDKAQKLLPELGQLVRMLFAGGRPPEQNYRTCNGLFSIYKKTDKDLFKKACLLALDCQSASYSFFLRVIKMLQQAGEIELQNQSTQLIHKNLRGPDYYKSIT